jgi:predicted metal-dependent phosphoesterase TrpH
MDRAPRFDLQSHSRHSDGELSAAEVVRAAAEAGVELLALTDHDTVDGVEEALAEARRAGIRLVPAAELSAVHGGREDLHVLGYGIDHRAPGWIDRLETFRADRELRTERMADRLAELGWALDRSELDARRAVGKSVGRPHLAQAAFGHPDNAARLAAEGIGDFSALLERYLIPGAAAYSPRSLPAVPEAIEAIHAAGGVAVWAHPFWDVEAAREVLDTVDAFAAQGLDGVEAFYVTYTREQTELLADHCERRGLLTTGSADFHGPGHPRFNRFRAFELWGREPRLGPIAG